MSTKLLEAVQSPKVTSDFSFNVSKLGKRHPGKLFSEVRPERRITVESLFNCIIHLLLVFLY